MCTVLTQFHVHSWRGQFPQLHFLPKDTMEPPAGFEPATCALRMPLDARFATVTYVLTRSGQGALDSQGILQVILRSRPSSLLFVTSTEIALLRSSFAAMAPAFILTVAACVDRITSICQKV